MSLPAEQREELVNMGNIDVNAHLKVEMVLNDDFDNFDDNYFDNIICYDSEADSSQEYDAVTSQTQENTSETSFDFGKTLISKKKSNAAQMRKYRAKQRSDPERYKIYLERERVRNHRRKYEKRVKAAQDRAIAMGLPYIVLEPYSPTTRRGRKPKYVFDDTMLSSEDQKSNLLYTDPNDGMLSMPVKVELTELDGVCQEHKPHISVVNIEKLTNRPRSALQTLLPQELNDRECSNFIKMDHDYVRVKREPIDEYFDNWMTNNQNSTIHGNKMSNKMNRDELLKLQEQCRSFISQTSTTATSSNGSSLPRSPRLMNRKRSKKLSRPREIADLMQNDSGEHEDLDDLFKELEEVANKDEPKIKKSKTSPVKKRHAEFSLTVEMPVQPMIPKIENRGKNPRLDNSEDVRVKSSNGSKIDNICDDEMRWWKRILDQEGMAEKRKDEQQLQQVEDDFIENIKKESDDDFCF